MTTQMNFLDGSLVQWVDKETLRYSDSDHTALIWVDFEPGFFTGGRVIKASSIAKWESCPSNESCDISDEIKMQIISKVTKYYDKYKVKYRIEQ